MTNELARFIDDLAQLRPVKLFDYQESLGEQFPILAAMAGCPQDRHWHAEGDVLIHTEMVMEAARRELATATLPRELKQAVYLSALLHDVGKPATTYTSFENRIVSPGHAGIGLPIAREMLYALGVPFKIRELTLMLILRHMVAYRMVKRILPDLRMRGINVERKRYWRLAAELDVAALYYLTRADWLGRIGTGIERVLSELETFRARCLHHNIWQHGLGYIDEMVPAELLVALGVTVESEQRRIRHELLNQSMAGLIETTADAGNYLKDHPDMLKPTSAHLYLTIGIPGSGKSSWLAEQLFFTRIVSSDVKREELFGDVNFQGDNAMVFKECYREVESALKRGEAVAMDATNTRLNQRTAFLHLARQLHAHTTIIYFDLPLETALSRNRQRARQVPEAAIKRYFHTIDAPRAHEAQELLVVAEPVPAVWQ